MWKELCRRAAALCRDSRRCAASLPFVALAAAWPATAAAAAPISVNPHRVECGAGPPPMGALASDERFDVNAYHVASDCMVSTALAYNDFGKPKILSDDARGYSYRDAVRWIERTARAGHHYEHFDSPLADDAGITAGQVIDDRKEFPRSSRRVLRALGRYASRLEPGGTLRRDGTELRWNGRPVRLMGFSWMGALAGKNVDPEGFLDALAHYGANLTRVWAIEQWTALAVKAPEPLGDNALTPFAGSFAEGWDLERLSDEYFARLRRFVDAAAERGIVVQLTLFDRHGVLNRPGDLGSWPGSPYNRARNRNDLLDPGPEGEPPPGFLDADGTAIGAVHRAFLERVRRELEGRGNVIYEVMNEPLAGKTWSDEEILAFHRWVAAVLRGSEPGEGKPAGKPGEGDG